MYRSIVQFSVAAFFVWFAASAYGAGFGLREWSATGQGNAFAGATAGAEDVSYMSYNPAGLTRHSGDQARIGVTYIAPQAEFSTENATTIFTSPIGGGNGGANAAPSSFAPFLYMSHQFSSDLFGGIAVYAPYGLTTDYDDGWTGRYHALKTDIKAIEFTPTLAYKITPKLSIGAGLRVMYARGEMSNAVDFGTLDQLPVENGGFGGAFGGTPAMDDGFAEVEGDDFGFGFSLGLLYQLDQGTRIGVAYRSNIKTDLKGDGRFENGTVGGAIAGATGAFVDTGISAKVDFPEMVSFGLYHEVSPRWAVMAEAAWTRWSRLEELRVKFDNPVQPDHVTPSDWENSWFVAAGATYRYSSNLTFRFGLAYDQTPVPDSTRTPRVPDEDRIWVSVGVQYALGKSVALDFGYTHFFLPDPKIDLSASEPDNALRGNLTGSYDASADILAAQIRFEL